MKNERTFEGVGGLKIASRSWRPEGAARGIVRRASGTITDAEVKRTMEDWRSRAIPADVIAQPILFAIEQPDIVDVGELSCGPRMNGDELYQSQPSRRIVQGRMFGKSHLETVP
jgi:hypothetical protein